MKIKLIKRSRASIGGFFTRALNIMLEKKAEAAVRPRKRVIRPSEIGYCERKIVLSILNVFTEPPPKPRVLRILDNGHKVHNRYLRHYIDRIEGITVLNVEDNFRDEFHWLKGSPDAVIADKTTGVKYVFELKSCKASDFTALQKPMEVHEAQVRTYMHLTKIDQAIVFYENKNTQETKEFLLTADETKTRELLDKCDRIIQYVENYDEKDPKLPDLCEERWCKACRQ